MSMPVFTPAGTKIKFAHPEAGYAGSRKAAADKLTIGSVYTIKTIDVGNWDTYLTLEEVLGTYTSVQFDLA